MSVKDVVERWLTKEYDYERPRRGQIRQGKILKIDEFGIIVDLGLKRDGFVPRTDLERLGEEETSSLDLGQELFARVARLEDQEGRLVLSLYQARFEKDWTRAQERSSSTSPFNSVKRKGWRQGNRGMTYWELGEKRRQRCGTLQGEFFANRTPIIASDRGPVVFETAEDGSLGVQHVGRGLVTALTGLCQHTDATWIACAQTEADVTWCEGNASLTEK